MLSHLPGIVNRSVFRVGSHLCYSSSTIRMEKSLLVSSNPHQNAVITLNRPKALNALDLDMCRDLRALQLEWKINPSANTTPALMIMNGAGEKAFCAGGDVKSIWEEIVSDEMSTDKLGKGLPGLRHSDFFRTEYEMNYLLGTSDVPQISFWDGFVMGGGVGISVLGKYRIATEKTVFAMPETAIGLFPDVGSSSWLPQLDTPNGIGLYLGLTGNRLYAHDLLRTGIATHYLLSKDLEDVQDAMMSIPVAIKDDKEEVCKRIEGILKEMKPKDKPDDSKSIVLKYADVISDCFDLSKPFEDIAASLQSHIDKGGENGAFAQKTLDTVHKMSPASCMLTYQQLKRGQGRSLKECLVMEYRLAQRCMAGGDFKEGIRAVLVDKDHNPQWPADTNNMQKIETYFDSLGEHDLDLDTIA